MLVTPPESANDVNGTLDRHALRRLQTVPTLSVLSGPVGLGIHCYRHWCAARGLEVVRVDCADHDGLVAGWVAGLARQRDLNADAVSFLAATAGRDAEDLRAALTRFSPRDFDQFWETLTPGDDGAGSAEAARWIARQFVAGQPLDPDRLATSLASALSRPPAGRFAVVSALSGLVPPGNLPALLLTQPPSGQAVTEWFDSAVRLSVGLVESIPRLSAGLAVETADLDRWLRAGSGDRARSLVREGIVAVAGLRGEELSDRLQAVGIAPEPLAATVRRLETDGASEELAAAFTEAARRLESPSGTSDEEGRSAAERFLFERLESLPATAGYFRLCATLDFLFGPRNAEVDLLAEDRQLAVEVDGYYHFTDPAAYRRDRRKDWELQRRGFLVLRFLAEDVVSRMEDVLDTILTAFDHCARQPHTPKGTDA
jgi:Protein of unknown function (DUF559)